MEQAPPDPERQLKPATLEPLGRPDPGLEAVAGEEAERAREEGSEADTFSADTTSLFVCGAEGRTRAARMPEKDCFPSGTPALNTKGPETSAIVMEEDDGDGDVWPFTSPRTWPHKTSE
ncbi:sorting nexin-4-like isoform X2 [Ictidomys tridecemlineatus]